MDKIFITIASVATAAFLVLSALIIISAQRRQRDAAERFHYRPRKQIMANPEKRCFQLLNDIFGERFYIIPNVDLPTLLSHKVGKQNRHDAYNFIADQTVNFVFCNKRTLRPVCAIKLDDQKLKTNLKNDPKVPSSNLETFFRSAHLPFIRLTNPKKLDRQTIIEEFSRTIYETSLPKLQNPKPPKPQH